MGHKEFIVLVLLHVNAQICLFDLLGLLIFQVRIPTLGVFLLAYGNSETVPAHFFHTNVH